MLWIAVLAVWAVMRLLQFLWNRNGRNWKGWEGDHEVPLTLWEYMEWGQMKKDLEDYVYFSWHYLCKVMKECWSVIILVQCWEMYWRLPMTGCEDVERQLVKILFLKGGSLMHQMYFQQCRTAKKVESIEVKQGHMEYRDSERACKDRSRHVAKLVSGYKPEMGDKIFLERGLRSHFEQVMESVQVAAPGEHLQADVAPDTGLQGYWKMLCTEVSLRHCRDVMAKRLHAIAGSLSDGGANLKKLIAMKSDAAKAMVMEDKILQDKFRAAPAAQLKEAKEKYENKWTAVESDRFLNNLKIKGIEFWTPLEGTADWAECDWNLKQCPYAGLLALKSQLLERREEIESMLSHALEWSGPAKMEMRMHLLEDMPDLVEQFLKEMESTGGSSAGEAVQTAVQRRSSAAS